MKIQLLGWQSKGLRCPDLNIDFTTAGRIQKVGLLQMPNGVGKTTTLACLRASLDGSAKDWPESKVCEFRATDNLSSDSGLFIVRLLIDDAERLTFEMSFDFDKAFVSYKTTYKKSQTPGFSPPPNLRMFLNPRFVSLFIFDGELAKQLLDEQGEDAGKVIDTFYELYLFEDMRRIAQQELEDKTKHSRSTNPAQVDRIERDIKALSKEFDKLASKATSYTAKSQEAAKRIKVLEDEVGERIRRYDKFREDEAKTSEALLLAGHELEKGLQKVSSEMPSPRYVHGAFAHGLQGLAVSLDRLKLPGPSSKMFFTELAEESECICGRVLDDSCRAHLLEKAKDILADDTSGFINALKDDIRHLGGDGETSMANSLINLRECYKQLGDAQQQKELIRIELSGDAEVRERQEELGNRKAELDEADAFLRDFNREPLPTDRSDTGCRKWFERELAAKRKQLAELTGTLDFKTRTDLLKRILEKAYLSAHSTLKAALIEDVNRRLETVLKQCPLRIADITTSIKLVSPSGTAQAGASVGQTLAIGYVFLTTLLNGAAHQFPLVVDSPAGPMDNDVRREVAPLVPQLCEQFVALTISPERECFVEPLFDSAEGDVKFYTAFRQNAANEQLIASLPKTRTTKSPNGVLVEGKEFFFDFQG